MPGINEGKWHLKFVVNKERRVLLKMTQIVNRFSRFLIGCLRRVNETSLVKKLTVER